LHGRILLEPAYLDSANVARRASVAVTAFNIAFRLQSGDLILTNVGLAKPMPRYLVYSKADLISAQTLAAMRAWPAAAMDLVDATIHRATI
jgi:hypothetical protein